MAKLKWLYAKEDVYIYVTSHFGHGITNHSSTSLLQ